MTRKTVKSRIAEDPAARLLALAMGQLALRLEAGECTTAELLKLLQHLQAQAPSRAPAGEDLHIVLAEEG